MPPRQENKETGDDTLFFIIGGILLLAILSGASVGVYFSVLGNINWAGIYNTIAITISVVNAFLFVLFLWVLFRFRKLDELEPVAKEVEPVSPILEVKEQWERIQELTASQNPSDWNMAIIRADALLDDMLMHLGYEGTTMGDRLKIVDPVQLPSVERVWSAHRLRNAIVHDPMEQHTREAITETLRAYEQAFKELGLLRGELSNQDDV